MFVRLKNHRDDHLRDRWEFFSWFGFRDVTKEQILSNKQYNGDTSKSISYGDALNEIEGILIQVLEPRLNKQGPKWQATAQEYVQDIEGEKGSMSVQEMAEVSMMVLFDLEDRFKDMDKSLQNLTKKN